MKLNEKEISWIKENHYALYEKYKILVENKYLKYLRRDEKKAFRQLVRAIRKFYQGRNYMCKGKEIFMKFFSDVDGQLDNFIEIAELQKLIWLYEKTQKVHVNLHMTEEEYKKLPSNFKCNLIQNEEI